MDYATRHPRDDKKPHDAEREKLLDKEFNPLSFEPDHASYARRRSRRSSWHHPRDSVPSTKDLLRLILFCAVTAFGMTLISQAGYTLGWSSKLITAETGDVKSDGISFCQSSLNTTSLSMDFKDATQFLFTQMAQDLPGHPGSSANSVQTLGNIEVRSAEQVSGSHVHVDLELRGSDSRLTSSEFLGIEINDYTLIVRTPKRLPTDVVPDRTFKLPCLYVSAIITLSSGAKLENLGINSETLDVVFKSNLEYAQSRVVETKTHFETTSTYSRETIIDVSSASVTGSFPLYDLLSIHTKSGSIDVDIVPKNASTENVKPADLHLSSNSGSVRSRTSMVDVPNRNYKTAISTSSGSIEVGVLHGSRTSLRSINGRLSADLYPYGHNNSRTNIEVHCTSGNIDVSLHTSLSHPTTPLKGLYGYYCSVSGSMDLRYPAQWQGTVQGTTSSGGVDFDWEGLKVVKDTKEGAKRFIEAVRGEGEGRLEFHESSGSVHLSGESGGV